MANETEDELEAERAEAALGAEMIRLIVELEQRFPDVVSLVVDPESGEIDHYDLHNAGPQYHDEFHEAEQFIKEKLHPLAKKAVYGDKSDSEIVSELMHEAIHQYPKVFGFDTDEHGGITGFRVKYDTKKNSANTLKAAKLYCDRLYAQIAALGIQMEDPIY